MKVTNAIKTGICADFLMESIVNYDNIKKSSKYSCLKGLEVVIEFYCIIRVLTIVQDKRYLSIQ